MNQFTLDFLKWRLWNNYWCDRIVWLSYETIIKTSAARWDVKNPGLF